MTYCVGIKLESGLIALADTRISSGLGISSAKKMYTKQGRDFSFFLMTSGLRSIRDKAVTYFDELFDEKFFELDKMYKVVNLYADQVKRVSQEDKAFLTEKKYSFDIHTIIGGQMSKDDEHRLFLVFPEGNWVEVVEETPYALIGNINFGKFILKRRLSYTDSPEDALKLAVLSLDATKDNVSDVDYPIDTIYLGKGTHNLCEKRFDEKDVEHFTDEWLEKLRVVLDELPNDWTHGLLPAPVSLPKLAQSQQKESQGYIEQQQQFQSDM